MKYILVVGLLLNSISASAMPASRFKGWEDTQSLLNARIMQAGPSVELSRYLPGMYAGPGSIFELLGTYSATTGLRTYKNGEPNSVNTLLWYVLLSSLGDELALKCNQGSSLKLHPKFEQSLAAICAWPAASAKEEAVMQEFWLRLMRYDAPSEEYEAWRDFFRHSSYQSKPAKEAVSAMVQAIFLNPFFLLEK